MNKKTKTILSMAGLALFIALAVFAYDRLSGRVKPDSALNVIDAQPAAAAEETAAPQAAEETAAPQQAQTPAGSEQAAAPGTASARESAGQEAARTERPRTKAPDFAVQDMNGGSVRLSDFLGKPVVVNFWASWCPPCKAEMPEFNKVHQELGEDVQFMMVDLVDGQRETRDKGARYVEEMGYGFPVFFDMDQSAAITYGVTSIPTTYFIDAEGYLVAGAQSPIDAETLMRGIGMIRP